jgi:hypothetical protein
MLSISLRTLGTTHFSQNVDALSGANSTTGIFH